VGILSAWHEISLGAGRGCGIPIKTSATTWEYRGPSEAGFYRHILPSLLEAGIAPQSITRREPKLEEVYLSLMGDKKSLVENENNEVEKVEAYP
jgi:hypothetical protein